MDNHELTDPLGKNKRWLAGKREKWCMLFLLCIMLILGIDAFIGDFDPVPYTQAILALGTTFILGQSATDWARSMKVGSIREEQVRQETQRLEKSVKIQDDSKPDIKIIQEYKEEYSDDPSYAPLAWIEKQGLRNEA